MFLVVAFGEKHQESVELVASNWLIINTTLYWPSFKSTTAISRAVRDRLEPDFARWQVHAYECYVHVISEHSFFLHLIYMGTFDYLCTLYLR